MNRTEWNDWHDDLKRRLPELAGYIAGLSSESRDVWFHDIFEPHELRDAMQLNYRMFEAGDGVSKWERDKLPSVLIKLLSDIKHERHKREEKQTRNQYSGAFKNVTERDPIMRQAYRYIVRKQDEYREQTGEDRTPDHLRKQWLKEAFAEFDT